MVDCAWDYDNYGCFGGLPSHAFEYFTDIGGVTTEVLYPYQEMLGDCIFKDDMAKVGIRGGSVNITKGDEIEL